MYEVRRPPGPAARRQRHFGVPGISNASNAGLRPVASTASAMRQAFRQAVIVRGVDWVAPPAEGLSGIVSGSVKLPGMGSRQRQRRRAASLPGRNRHAHDLAASVIDDGDRFAGRRRVGACTVHLRFGAAGAQSMGFTAKALDQGGNSRGGVADPDKTDREKRSLASDRLWPETGSSGRRSKPDAQVQRSASDSSHTTPPAPHDPKRVSDSAGFSALKRSPRSLKRPRCSTRQREHQSCATGHHQARGPQRVEVEPTPAKETQPEVAIYDPGERKTRKQHRQRV